MKVFRKPRLNRTVVSVAVEMAASLSRVLSCMVIPSIPAFSTQRFARFGHMLSRLVNDWGMVYAVPADRCARPVDRHMPKLAEPPAPVERRTDVRSTLIAVAVSTFAFALPVHAQEKWPQRQVTVVVPFTAGGTTDMFGRIFAQKMQEKHGTP